MKDNVPTSAENLLNVVWTNRNYFGPTEAAVVFPSDGRWKVTISVEPLDD